MGILDRAPAVLTIRVLSVHPCTEWARAVQRVERDQVFELVRAEVAHQGTHRATLELEHTNGVPLAEEVVHGLIIECHIVDIGPGACVSFDQFECAIDRCEVPQAKEVHLQQAERFDAVHLVLRHHLCILTLLLNGNDVGQWLW